MLFSELTVPDFGAKMSKSYPKLFQIILPHVFALTYRCEAGFSPMLEIKSKFRKPELQPTLTTFLDPCLIKDTNINAFSLDGTGISNIDNIIKETGKVTAVVAVMQVNSNPIKER